MINNLIKSAWRSLVFNKKYAVINITGLAVSMAACILIGLSVYHETSFDSYIPGKENVYRLNEYMHYDGAAPQLSAAIGPPIAAHLKNTHGEIEAYTRVFKAMDVLPPFTIEYGGKKIDATNLVCTDSSFARMFGIHIIAGDRHNFIPLQNNIALTESMSKKIFGSSPGLNKMIGLRVDDTTVHQYVVSQIINDFAGNSHMQADGMLAVPAEFEKGFVGTNYGILLGPTYLRLRAGTNAGELEAKLTETVHEKNKGIDMRLQAVSALHGASTDISYDYFNYNKIDGKYINVFVIIAIAIFVIACVNFINLTIAIAAYRGKEIGIKRIAGASRAQLALQLLAEAFISVLMALVLAVLLANITLPFLNRLLNRNLSANFLYQWPVLASYGVILISATLLAGIYPALLIAFTKVNLSIKTKLLFGGTRSSVRNVLAIGQFAIAVIFIVCLIVFVKQMDFLQNKDLGYSYSQVIKIPIDDRNAARTDVLLAGLSKVKGVSDVTYSLMEFGSSGARMGVNYISPDGQKQQVSVNFENAAKNFVPFFEMKITKGRNVNAANEYLVNETMAQQMGYDNPVGKPINLTSWPQGVVAGVVKDYNYSSLHSTIEPLIIGSIDFVPRWKKNVYVKISTANVFETVRAVESSYKTLSGNNEINWQFLDEHFKEIYKSEKQAGTMVAVIGGLSIGIACLGLLGLAAFIMAKRTKEIGIRKVLGASVGSVIGNLSKEFIRMVLIAFVIAAPLAYWLSDSWLQDFAYRIAIGWWMFALAGGIIVLIAFLTVVFLAVRAAVANPVVALRYE